MKTAPFRYERPTAIDDALALLADEDAKAIAGGQSLVPVMAMRLARPRVLVDLSGLVELNGVHPRSGALETGAMVRQRVLERRPALAAELPLIAAALPHVGHREIRNRGTIGGSVAHADPAAELGLVAATLDATIITRGPSGTRELSADGFAHGPFQTALQHGELLTSIRWPLAAPRDGHAFEEVARRHGDFALCGVAVRVRDGTARIGLLGVGPAPVVRSVTLDAEPDFAAVADGIGAGLTPSGDFHASADYRRHLARVLVARCLRRAWEDVT